MERRASFATFGEMVAIRSDQRQIRNWLLGAETIVSVAGRDPDDSSSGRIIAWLDDA